MYLKQRCFEVRLDTSLVDWLHPSFLNLYTVQYGNGHLLCSRNPKSSWAVDGQFKHLFGTYGLWAIFGE